MFRAKEVPHVPGWRPDVYDKLEKRARKLDTSLLIDFADVSGSALSRAFSSYRREADEASLYEIEEALESLWAVARELRRRA